ncbi:lipocalin family protein [Flavivirga aquimarina]|uniref:Lipocalin family protein n=1 Tax=Flavivirga aquimarina TaxID=2027862 RepID=A0ABT8WE56_9FLAO|nr:lipocalin family protein [Flavivirga aquimarina]MDO5971386.1 lipocalin family protein [Flavivirga aquimarina]
MTKTKTMNKLFLTLLIGVLFSCSSDNNDNEPEQSSILGTWKIVSLTSNGTEELQDELNYADICYWTEIYTQTTVTDIDFSGTDCTTETVGETLSYTIDGTTLSYITGDQVDVSLEIIELTSTTLKLQDSFEELGEDYVDIYTYTKVE